MRKAGHEREDVVVAAYHARAKRTFIRCQAYNETRLLYTDASVSLGTQFMTRAADDVPEPFRDGNLVIVRNGMSMPYRCPICNDITSNEPVKMTFSPNRATGLVGRALEAVAGEDNRPVTATFYLCRKHGARRKHLWLGIAIAFAVSIVAMILCALWGDKHNSIYAYPLLIAVAITAVTYRLAIGTLNPWFSAKKFSQREVWLKGAGPAYLASLRAHRQGPWYERIR